MAALEHIILHNLNVAAADAYIDSLLSPSPAKEKKRKPTYIIKDVRLFLNTVSRGLSMMKTAGVDAHCKREETDSAIFLTIEIPKTR